MGISCILGWPPSLCAQVQNPSGPREASAPTTTVKGWEGALGPVVRWSREGSGLVIRPGYYLRYQRISVSNTSSFAVRHSGDVFQGLGLELPSEASWRFNLGLRLDKGTRITELPTLAGFDRVRPTLRLRVALTYPLTPRWSVGGGWSTDILGRGGGQVLHVGATREVPLSPRTRWVVGLGLSAANQRYQQARFGVSETQAQLSGLPRYEAHDGLLDASVSTSVRTNFSHRWVGFMELSAVSRMGPQRNSPLVNDSGNWGASVGIARRF